MFMSFAAPPPNINETQRDYASGCISASYFADNIYEASFEVFIAVWQRT